MLEFSVNRAKRRIEIAVDEFLDLGDLVNSERDLREGVGAILRDHSLFDMLVCVNVVGPASREASSKMDETFTQFLDERLRKAAHVGLGPLAVLQMRRVTRNDPRFQFFDDRATAEAWLDD